MHFRRALGPDPKLEPITSNMQSKTWYPVGMQQCLMTHVGSIRFPNIHPGELKALGGSALPSVNTGTILQSLAILFTARFSKADVRVDTTLGVVN